ncbi:DUF2255 family protein [bacterium]|nr:MAG: DUF2255 family protein [bacterium]
MTTWTSDELNRIEKAEELNVSSRRGDGTLRSQRTIWVVRVGDDLYVRSVNGRGSDWFRGVLTRHEGRIEAGGVAKEVQFVEQDDAAIHQQIDAAYRQKYRHYPAAYVDSCLTPKARAATIQLVPRPADS